MSDLRHGTHTVTGYSTAYGVLVLTVSVRSRYLRVDRRWHRERPGRHVL